MKNFAMIVLLVTGICSKSLAEPPSTKTVKSALKAAMAKIQHEADHPKHIGKKRATEAVEEVSQKVQSSGKLTKQEWILIATE